MRSTSGGGKKFVRGTVLRLEINRREMYLLRNDGTGASSGGANSSVRWPSRTACKSKGAESDSHLRQQPQCRVKVS